MRFYGHEISESCFFMYEESVNSAFLGTWSEGEILSARHLSDCATTCGPIEPAKDSDEIGCICKYRRITFIITNESLWCVNTIRNKQQNTTATTTAATKIKTKIDSNRSINLTQFSKTRNPFTHKDYKQLHPSLTTIYRDKQKTWENLISPSPMAFPLLRHD